MKFLVLAFGLASLAQAYPSWKIGQTVSTTSGNVEGHKASDTNVSEYLGIPFAKPPVGDLRWAKPEKFEGKGKINGSKYGFSCPSNPAIPGLDSPGAVAGANLTAAGVQILSFIAQVGDVFSEDCLTVNVWTKPQVGESKKAVLVWIYGGGFSTGSSRTAAYNGQYIVEQEDVIVVSFNYRLKIFGFPGSPSTSNNLGLLDQRLAIKWVRDNIESFGGDCKRITLFGQSAGGGSMDYHSFAWPSDPIVAGYIAQSGSVVFDTTTPSAATSAESWFAVSKTLGCGDSSAKGKDVLKCMRSKEFSAILAALSTTPTASFQPTVDEVVVFSDYVARAAAGKFTKRPLLIGQMDFEGGLYQTIAALGGVFPGEEYWKQYTDSSWTCPISARANVSITYNVPTWRYRYFGVFPNTRLTSSPESGAYHAGELPVLFNATPKINGPPQDTQEEIAFGKYFRGAWAAFAKDPVRGLKSYGGGWPEYVPGKKTLVRLAYDNKTGSNATVNTAYDASCGVIFPVGGKKL